ncbi:MAG: tRNA-uridine aminocarboxypropyltransferase [Pseudobdellovibrio sp.]
MNVKAYKLQRENLEKEKKRYRELCQVCRQPTFSCYCSHIKSFDPRIKFIILMHPIEMKRRIATGRMSHLTLENSELIVGQNYSENSRVNEILAHPNYEPVVLYPGVKSLNLTEPGKEIPRVFKSGKTPVVFVIDGTWATARKMMRQSENLHGVPRVCFTPSAPSQFKVRKQPKAECFSTIEAIHQCVELLGEQVGFNLLSREHDNLIHVFSKMVERQLYFIREAFDNPRSTSYRRVKHRVA